MRSCSTGWPPGRCDRRWFTFRHVLEDIESLNRKATEGLYDLTAISYHAYPYVADKYVLMAVRLEHRRRLRPA